MPSSTGFAPGNTFFNNFQPGVSPYIAAATTPAPQPVIPPLMPGQSGSASTSTAASTGSTSGSTRTFVPNDWVGTANSGMPELAQQYRDSGAAFDTTETGVASSEQQARDLSKGMAAANNAANEYASRTRQAGGNSGAAGVIKAQGIISATDAAGKAKLEQAKYEVQQREAAATHAGQIAQSLAALRDSYLAHLVGQDTTGSQVGSSAGSQSSVNQAANAGGGGGLYGTNTYVPTIGPLRSNAPNLPAGAPAQWTVPGNEFSGTR